MYKPKRSIDQPSRSKPCGYVAQLADHCTGIAAQRSWVRIQLKPSAGIDLPKVNDAILAGEANTAKIRVKIFKVVAKVGNPSLFSGATAVQSRPKSHRFAAILAVFARQPRWRQKA